MKSSWKKIRSKKIHKNRWFFLREDDVVCPDGKEGKYFFVDGIHGAAVLPVDDKGSIYLAGQSRYPIGNSYIWAIIGGKIKKGLTPLQGAKEELREEAGIIAKKWKSLGYIYSAPGYSVEKVNLFVAEKLSHVDQKLDSTEDIHIKKFSVQTMRKMIKENRIVCSHTISAFCKYLLWRNSR